VSTQLTSYRSTNGQVIEGWHSAHGHPAYKRAVTGSNPVAPTRRSSSLKERAGVKGGFGLQLCGGMAFAGHGGMALWLAFPDRCRVRVSGLAGQGPGGARPRSGAAGVLDALVREPIMAGAGKGRGRVHGLCGYGRPIAGCPAGRTAGCLHPLSPPVTSARSRQQAPSFVAVHLIARPGVHLGSAAGYSCSCSCSGGGCWADGEVMFSPVYPRYAVFAHLREETQYRPPEHGG
jgi:hypothetical protein